MGATTMTMEPDGPDRECEPGHLRDVFAAHALTGLLANPAFDHDEPFRLTARTAYDLADAMLAHRRPA